MIDTHYDLLSICYSCYIKNDYRKIRNISEEIKSSGVKCIFANLYFMSKEEMEHELGKNYYQENISVLEMFKISKKILNDFLPNTNFIYSIEGCDYVEIENLDELYEEGLRSIALVWNNQNKYGSGNRSDIGLTNEGKEFLNKAIDLGIGIDLSHANGKTFNDMIILIKKRKSEGKEVICYASHSNSKSLYESNRNLSNAQLLQLKEVNGLVGVFSNRFFITNHSNKQIQRTEYMKHINYIASIVGLDKVMVSTDDMRFAADIDYEYNTAPIYDYKTIYKDLVNDLRDYFGKTYIEDILYNNAQNKIVDKLLEGEKKYDRY